MTTTKIDWFVVDNLLMGKNAILVSGCHCFHIYCPPKHRTSRRKKWFQSSQFSWIHFKIIYENLNMRKTSITIDIIFNSILRFTVQLQAKRCKKLFDKFLPKISFAYKLSRSTQKKLFNKRSYSTHNEIDISFLK